MHAIYCFTLTQRHLHFNPHRSVCQNFSGQMQCSCWLFLFLLVCNRTDKSGQVIVPSLFLQDLNHQSVQITSHKLQNIHCIWLFSFKTVIIFASLFSTEKYCFTVNSVTYSKFLKKKNEFVFVNLYNIYFVITIFILLNISFQLKIFKMWIFKHKKYSVLTFFSK